MTSREQTVRRLGFDIPEPARPIGAYVPAVRSGNLVFTAGQIPAKGGKLILTGKVPTDVSLEQAQAAAREALLNALGALRGEIGSLDRVVRIVRLNVFVNSAPGFTDQARVANAASELLEQIFGDAGPHTRCAVGAAELPLNSPIELDLIAEVE